MLGMRENPGRDGFVKFRLKHLSSCWQEGGLVQEGELVKAAFQSDISSEGKPGEWGRGGGVWKPTLNGASGIFP